MDNYFNTCFIIYVLEDNSDILLLKQPCLVICVIEKSTEQPEISTRII